MNNLLIDSKNAILLGKEIEGDVTVKARGVIIRNCKINGNLYLEGSMNCLIAQNVVSGEITVRSTYNCSIVLNKAQNIICQDNTNVYVIENDANSLTLERNVYIIADNNTYSALFADNNINMNGDTLTDVNERAKEGALPKNQPHTNRELFVEMERQTTVRDGETDSLPLNKYLQEAAKTSDVVIVPPGAYAVSAITTVNEPCINTKYYLYGVYLEMTERAPLFNVDGSKNIEVLGLTVGYSQQSCGQAHVLKQTGDSEFIIVPSAGSIDDFASTNTAEFAPAVELIPEGKRSTTYFVGPNTIEKNPDGTMTFTLTTNNTKGRISAGDMLCCRIGGGNKFSLRINNSKNILFRDFTIYGYAAALAIIGEGTSERVRFERMHNTVHTGPIIDKETYWKYKALEAEYGVDLHVSIDFLGRYRGCPSAIGSVDALHVIGAKTGFDVVSSILEQMTDDGANQHAASSRLAKITDNGDGTSTIRYKSSLSEVYFRMGAGASNCINFSKGDRVFMYNSNGQRVCDTPALSDAHLIEESVVSVSDDKMTRDVKIKLYEMAVATEALNLACLDGYDLNDDHYRMDNKVLVDNLSRNSVGYIYDNVTIKNTRSRGILFKTMNVTAQNCTFKNLAHTGCLLSVEYVWGESTVGCDAAIKNCIFDNVGYINNYDYYLPLSPISIVGFSKTVSEDTLLYKNILIEGNRFKNNTHDYQINVNSAENVRIINNVFEPNQKENDMKPKKVINIDTAMNIEISGNKYSHFLKDIKDGIDAKNYKNVHGTDITLNDDVE
ncbi:MAG: hypothetical protein E7611_02305 [Ruminococcaceae bacterium]|nr:hypothetical protein [Oscillospiraceae bacterium]